MSGADHATLQKIQTSEREAVQNSDIVLNAQGASPGAFAELHAIYSRRLYKKIFAITRNPEDAEDALQDTFLRAYLAFHAFEGRSNVYTWLTRIAVNSALMILRRRRARPEMLFDPQPENVTEAIFFAVKDSAPNPEEVCDLYQQRVRVLHAIRKLDPPLQTPIRMQMTKGSSIREIGRALNISQAAVKARLHRARRRLFILRDVKRPEPARQSVDLTRFARRTIIETSNRS